MLAYEAAGLIDGSPFPGSASDDPPIVFLVLDRAVVFDHWRQRLLLIAHVPREAGLDGGMAAVEELAARVESSTPLRPDGF